MIETVDVSKSFGAEGKQSTVVRNISIRIPTGSCTAIVGPSGSGKSTLLNLIGGLERPDSGKILIGDTEITGRTPEYLARFRLEHIGLVFQFFNLLPTLSLLENVALAAYLAGKSKKTADDAARKFLQLVGLEREVNRLPHEVSGGEVQRAAIARALINEPKVILADEPTGSLDRANGDQVFDLFIQLSRSTGATLVVVTHDQRLEAKAGNVIRLLDGSVQP
ncbi:MAG: ABC transporter ATP-binding protein [Bdellovibrionota bacterium]